MRWADVDLAVVTSPITVEELTPGERARLPGGRRRHDFLLGRAALRAQGIADTARLAFPNRCLSLTHAAGVAVAARCEGDQAGLGVDLEGWRSIGPRAARFFLRPQESATCFGSGRSRRRCSKPPRATPAPSSSTTRWRTPPPWAARRRTAMVARSSI